MWEGRGKSLPGGGRKAEKGKGAHFPPEGHCFPPEPPKEELSDFLSWSSKTLHEEGTESFSFCRAGNQGTERS